MGDRRIHLIAPAASCRPFFAAIGVGSAGGLIELVQAAVGPRFRVTGDESLIDAEEKEHTGGRSDDRRRAEDIESALADSGVAAVVALRGGAWLTRILPRIDFSVLDRRGGPVAVFGFSELTTLVNIVGGRGYGLGIYDMGPAFLTYGLNRHASLAAMTSGGGGASGKGWMLERLRPEFTAFFQDVVAIIEGRGTRRSITARLVGGELPPRSEGMFVGGNLTVLSTLLGSPYATYVDPAGRWLLLEDFNDKIERIDRFLAHLTLAGWWERCAGLLLGDFHKGYDDQASEVQALLPYHLPETRSLPVLVTADVGHVWPMAPLPLHRMLSIECREGVAYSIAWPAGDLGCV